MFPSCSVQVRKGCVGVSSEVKWMSRSIGYGPTEAGSAWNVCHRRMTVESTHDLLIENLMGRPSLSLEHRSCSCSNAPDGVPLYFLHRGVKSAVRCFVAGVE